jgi:hypothetical protein
LTPFHRRLLLAIACSVAIHEIVIGAGGFLRMQRESDPRESVDPTRVVLEIRTPSPTAAPTVAPSPKVALVQSVAAPRATLLAVHTGGSKGAPKLEVHTQKVVHHKESLPIWWAAMHASKTVASTGAGTEPTPGPGASSGTGTGTGAGSENGPGGGTGGNGSGVANATAPCGSPVFYRIHAQYNRQDGSFDDTIRVQLTLGSGQTLDGVFPYAWHYASEADDPFSQKGSDDDGVMAKLPPPGLDRSKEPLAVRLTLAKTLPDGRTLFDPCPPGVGKDL